MQTALERLLVPERERRQTAQRTLDGFAVPSLAERPLEPSCEPLLASNMKGQLLQTRVSRERGVARYGFFECLPEREAPLVQNLFDCLHALALSEQGVSPTLFDAFEALRLRGFEPRTLVVPFDLLKEASGSTLDRQDAEALMAAQGFVTLDDNLQVLLGDLRPGQALLAAAPSFTGYHVRVDDRLALLITRATSAFQLIEAS